MMTHDKTSDKNTNPIQKKEDVQKSNDERIDQDSESNDSLKKENKQKDEIESDGSGSAFSGTEEVKE
ncbi:MAG: hypothetical protein ABJA79_05150 [Parafilimonas sp.]